jgi:hypothetical protein
MNTSDAPAVLFINCAERNHGEIYRNRAAFYDLGTDGIQASQATYLRPGDICVVATPTSGGRVSFDWYSLQRVKIQPDNTGAKNRVFIGTSLKHESMMKSKATRYSEYAAFFNVNGHFKRQSTLKPR